MTETVPPTVTPPPDAASNEPVGTESVTVIVPDAASTSAIDSPVSWTWVSSAVVQPAPGSVLTGGSLTGFTVMVAVAVAVSPFASVT